MTNVRRGRGLARMGGGARGARTAKEARQLQAPIRLQLPFPRSPTGIGASNARLSRGALHRPPMRCHIGSVVPHGIDDHGDRSGSPHQDRCVDRQRQAGYGERLPAFPLSCAKRCRQHSPSSSRLHWCRPQWPRLLLRAVRNDQSRTRATCAPIRPGGLASGPTASSTSTAIVSGR